MVTAKPQATNGQQLRAKSQEPRAKQLRVKRQEPRANSQRANNIYFAHSILSAVPRKKDRLRER